MLGQLEHDPAMSHMPFLAPGPDGKAVLIYCRAGDDHLWKLHYLDAEGVPRRIATGLPNEAIECSPTAWHDERGWHVSLVAGGARRDPRFRLYRLDGPSLDELFGPVALQPAASGFVHRDRLVVGEKQDRIHVHDAAGDRTFALPGINIYRVSYRPDTPERLLISGQWIGDEEVFCIEYDLASGVEHMLKCDGRPAYKCAILGDDILYADRCGEHFEARRLRASNRFVRRRTRIAELERPDDASARASSKPCCGQSGAASSEDPATRPSCLECVEKHLGAAWALLAETRDGYGHRLRAIGHLHEAEDESQQWPELHNAIRAARKSFQRGGQMPDFHHLATVAASIGAIPSVA